MLMQDILSGTLNQTDPLTRAELRKKQFEEKSFALPASWGSDRVSISPEAREAARQSAFAVPKEETQDAPENSSAPSADFAAYMKKSRSKAQNCNFEEQLKSLQDKLKGLQSQMMQVASSESPDSGTSSRTENLRTQITAVVAEIAEISAKVAQEKAGEVQKAAAS